MSLFTHHTDKTAPEEAAKVLTKVHERYGFIPNLAAYVAESPVVLDAIMNMAGTFDKVSLSAQEQQLVLLTTSAFNGCNYCRTVHTALGRIAEIDPATLEDIIAFRPLQDKKLNSLRNFSHRVVENRGWVNEADVQAFLDAGYQRAQVFEVVLGVALKTLTNYCNHIAGATPNPEFTAMAEGQAAA